MPDEAPLAWDATQDEADDPYLMSNLFPQDTGLPMTVWVQVKGGARHDARVKVSPQHGRRVILDDMATVAVRPEPKLLHGDLSRRDLEAVSAWITLNREVIIDHWNGEADAFDLVRRLRPLPG